MRKYLELFINGFDETIEVKTKPKNKPYVAYSTKLGKVTYTVVPTSTPDEPVIELPPNNEIWYTSSDGTVVSPSDVFFYISVVSNTYENGKGVITFNGDVTDIGEGAFRNRSSLTSVTIPNSVTSFSEEAFYGCSSLISVTIPNGVTRVRDFAFSNCSSLTSITYDGTQEQWNTVTKGGDWNYNVPATYVQCTDGQVAL